MSVALRYLEFLSLATWVGGIVFFSAVVAPGAFRTLSNRDLSGAVVSMALARLHWLGYGAGVVFLVARLARLRLLNSLASPTALLVGLMLALTIVSQQGVSPRMQALRAEMGSVEAAPPESPLRLEFNRLHRVSVRLEAAILLAGLVALFFLVREGSP